MPLITATTKIKAPLERVFDLSRSVEFHLDSAGDSEEKVVAGVQSGLLGEGDEVTWEGSHLKFRQKLHVRVSAMDHPRSFTDEMVSGPFKYMKHHHRFEEDEKGTLMTDEFDYQSRGGPIGWFVENSYLTAHLRRFIADRNQVLKQVAESDEWKSYL